MKRKYIYLCLMSISEFSHLTGACIRTIYNDITNKRIKYKYEYIPGRLRPSIFILTDPSKYVRRSVGKPKSRKK